MTSPSSHAEDFAALDASFARAVNELTTAMLTIETRWFTRLDTDERQELASDIQAIADAAMKAGIIDGNRLTLRAIVEGVKTDDLIRTESEQLARQLGDEGAGPAL